MTGSGVFLVGLRGSGKTSVGRALAAELALPFLDSDEELEKESQRSCAALLQELGIQGFRQAEARLYGRLGPELRRRPCVLALGGGTLEAPHVLPLFESLKARHGWTCIWLDAAPSTLAQRSDSDERPRLAGRNAEEEARLLLARRGPGYDRISDLRVETTNVPIEELARRLAARLRRRGGDPA